MGIPNIASQMARNDLIFSFKTLNNLNVCSEILGRFNFRMPTRSLRYFQQYFQLSNYEIMSKYETPIIRFSKICNKYFNLFFLNLFLLLISYTREKCNFLFFCKICKI